MGHDNKFHDSDPQSQSRAAIVAGSTAFADMFDSIYSCRETVAHTTLSPHTGCS